jgi:hypothetical protein
MSDIDWTKGLKPDEARAALDALNANKAPVTAREATELLKLYVGRYRPRQAFPPARDTR